MSDISTLERYIALNINDPNHDEVDTGAGSPMMDWINRVVKDAAKLTDCLQTKIQVKGTGTAEAFDLPTGGVSYITVLDYATLETDNTVVTITINGTATNKTEDSDWQAGASNTACATSLAAALTAITGVTASSNGAVITVTADVGYTINSLTSTSSQTDLFIDNSLIWRVLNVVDRTNGRVYLPITREDYQDHYVDIVVNSIGGEYIFNVFGYGDNRQIYILDLVANAQNIDIDASITHPAIVYVDGSETPLGLLNESDELIVCGVSTIYYGTNDDTERAQYEFANYMDRIKQLSSEVGTNPVILPEMSSLYRFIGKTMKELRNT